MSLITKLQEGKKRAKVFLNGHFAFSLNPELLKERGLEEGQSLSDTQIEELLQSNLLLQCHKSALRLLNYRPRSQAELRRRLLVKGFPPQTVEQVILKLKEQGAIDDKAFARFWIESRENFNPRSRWLIQSELKEKGIASDIADQAIEDWDEEEVAYKAGVKKARLLARQDYKTFRQKLASFLKRRGFSWEVTRHTIERLWQEKG